MADGLEKVRTAYARGAESTGYTRYAVGLLTVLYVLNNLDRQVLSILAEPIKRALGLADWQLGVMTGLAFAVLYCLLGIPVARLAERGDRAMIISVSAAVWSGFTVLCGVAQNFTHLVLARVGVGIGEAGCTPPAMSLISEYVRPERRASAIAVYFSGGPIGSLLGLVIGGLVADRWGWRTAFFVVGAPGLLISVIAAFSLAEPRRHLRAASSAIKAEAVAHHNLMPALRLLWSKRTYRFVVIGATVKAFVQYGMGAFLASFFFRNHASEMSQFAAHFGLQATGFLGVALGLTTGVTGAAGAILGGQLGDRFAKRDIRNQARMPALAIFVSMPILLGALFVDSFALSMALLVVPGVLNALYYGPTFSIVQGLVPSTMRATATAIMLFIINMIALGLGPLAIGVLSDILSGPMGMGEADGIRWSLATFVLLSLPAGLVFYAAGASLKAETVS